MHQTKLFFSFLHRENNLKVVLQWGYTGFTALTTMQASVHITRIHPSESIPLDQIVNGTYYDKSFTYDISENEKSIKLDYAHQRQASSIVQSDATQSLSVSNDDKI